MTARNNSATTLTLPTDREIAITRVFDAPRELVFDAWTSPEHVVRWWGPRRFTLPVCQIDLRPGGAWRHVLRGPDGKDYGFRGEYREILRPERLVYTESFDGVPAVALVTLVFENLGGRTRLLSTSLYDSVEHRNGHLNSGMEAGMRETLDRLAEHLGVMS